jgi:hypothetical protein
MDGNGHCGKQFNEVHFALALASMPSSSFGKFEYNLVDVDRLVDSHGKLHAGNPGKKGLGHITRSAVVMLCASWELYMETLLCESGKFLMEAITLADQLPVEVQKQLSSLVRNDKHDLAPLRLAGDGWKVVYSTLIETRTESLNTPKSGKLVPLFSQLLGVGDLATAWTLGIKSLDDFVGVRGDIAHRGRHAAYVPIWKVKSYRDEIRQYAVETDNFIAAHLKAITPAGHKPWNVAV